MAKIIIFFENDIKNDIDIDENLKENLFEIFSKICRGFPTLLAFVIIIYVYF